MQQESKHQGVRANLLNELDIDLVSNVSHKVKLEALILLVLLMNSFLLPSYMSLSMMLGTMILLLIFRGALKFENLKSYF